MLSEEERKEIEMETRKYLRKRAAVPEALKILQRHHGWVSNNNLKDVASYFNMTEDEVDSIGTCYNFVFRKPAGKHLILVCDSVSCWIMGYEKILEHLKSRLGINFGETTEDGRFTLLPVACLGACDCAPAMMIDETLYGNLDPSGIDRILETYK